MVGGHFTPFLKFGSYGIEHFLCVSFPEVERGCGFLGSSRHCSFIHLGFILPAGSSPPNSSSAWSSVDRGPALRVLVQSAFGPPEPLEEAPEESHSQSQCHSTTNHLQPICLTEKEKRKPTPKKHINITT